MTSNVYSTISTALASIGLVLATSSLISGMQIVRGTYANIEGKIHRFNGIASIIIYCILAALSFINYGVSVLQIIGWLSGFFLIFLKLSVVMISRKKRRAFKYVSWLGSALILMWLYIIFINLPL